MLSNGASIVCPRIVADRFYSRPGTTVTVSAARPSTRLPAVSRAAAI